MNNSLNDFYSIVEPTLTFFDKATFVNYKKVGTRFMGVLSSFCNKTSINPQIDLRITFRDTTKNSNFFDFDGYKVNVLCDNKNDLFHYLGADDYTSPFDYLLNNNNRDIVYVIRNPMKRFMSGFVETIYAYISDLTDVNIINLKTNCGFDDRDIILIKNYFNRYRNTDFTPKIDMGILKAFYDYFITYKYYFIIDDIHLQNYLFFYYTMIKKSKTNTVKIIDIDSCNTEKALNFFQGVSDFDITDFWNEKIEFKQSNQLYYDSLVNSLSEINHVYSYLKYEFIYYDKLINSEHYIDLS
jgi:hypothetical protein